MNSRSSLIGRYKTKNFYEYLELNGGIEKMKKLRAIELLIDKK